MKNEGGKTDARRIKRIAELTEDARALREEIGIMRHMEDVESGKRTEITSIMESAIIAKDRANILCKAANDRYARASAFMDALRAGMLRIAREEKMTMHKARKVAESLIEATLW